MLCDCDLRALQCADDTQYRDRAAERRERFGVEDDVSSSQTVAVTHPLAADHKGFQLLARMGWKSGEGLGKVSSGTLEPVPMLGNSGRMGLGVQGASELVCVCAHVVVTRMDGLQARLA